MRALIFGMMLACCSVGASSESDAADPGQYEIHHLRLGMAPDEIKLAGKKAKLGEFREIRSPSFEQAVAIAQRKSVSPNAFSGVQEMRAKGNDASIQISFAPTQEGPRAWRIVYSWLNASLSRDALRQEIFSKYGQPEKQLNREWLWGDTATFFDARTKPYLEFRIDPASAGVEKPIATLTLADQSIQRASKAAIDNQTQR